MDWSFPLSSIYKQKTLPGPTICQMKPPLPLPEILGLKERRLLARFSSYQETQATTRRQEALHGVAGKRINHQASSWDNIHLGRVHCIHARTHTCTHITYSNTNRPFFLKIVGFSKYGNFYKNPETGSWAQLGFNLKLRGSSFPEK